MSTDCSRNVHSNPEFTMNLKRKQSNNIVHTFANMININQTSNKTVLFINNINYPDCVPLLKANDTLMFTKCPVCDRPKSVETET